MAVIGMTLGDTLLGDTLKATEEEQEMRYIKDWKAHNKSLVSMQWDEVMI